jgi:hypothetical protein
MQLKNGAVLHCSRGTPFKRALVHPVTKTLTPKTREIFSIAFDEFSTEGKMGKSDY